MSDEAFTFDFEGVGPVLFERSRRARRVVISVRPFRGIRVAVPRGVSIERALSFARGRVEWMRRQLEKVRAIERETIHRREREPAIDREEARAVLTMRLRDLAHRHGFTYNRVFIRAQKTRWGSCSAKNNINLNMRLLLLPGELVDYVLLHELVHTRIKNHGPRFWEELDRYVGDSRSLRHRLKEFDLV